jgi:DNA invertase Pin-like site-specific DNA recombinase
MSIPLREQSTHGDLQPGDSVDIYLRISRDADHDELGVKRQEKECRELCHRRGWRVVLVHKDDDRSAFSGKRREGYEDLLRRIEFGQVRGVVAWHPDRLHRSTKELVRFIEIVNASGAGVATVQGGDYDLTTAAGRMSAVIVGAVAAHESEHKSERLRSKMNQLRETGRFVGGGKRPFGYEKRAKGSQLQDVVPAEAVVIRELTRRRLGGESMLSLIRDLNARGIKSATGGPWGLASISRLLKSLRIAGLRINEKGEAGPAPWPAIITVREHRQLVTLLARNKNAGTRSQRSYLMTGGLVVCGYCGKPMLGRPINGKPTYGCDKQKGGCSKVWVRSANVDELVRQTVVAMVDGGGLAKRVDRRGGKEEDRVLDSITQQEDRLKEIEQDYANRELDRGEYRRLRDQAKARLEELSGGIKPTTTIDYGKDNPLAIAWPELSLGQRRAVLDAVLTEVRVAPVGRGKGIGGSKFDGSRVSLKWRA